MLKVKKINFRTNKSDLQRLFDCNRISAKVYNDCLQISKNYSKQTGKWITKTELQKATKRKYPLHSQSIQAVCHKYLDARDAARSARAKGYNNRYPWREKNYFSTKWTKDGFRISEDKKRITLSLGIKDRKRQKSIVVRVKNLPQGKIKEIELVYNKKLMLAVCFEDGKKILANNSTQVAAIDMGEIHSIASVSETGKSLIITARELRSIKRLRNKKYREIYKKLARRKKGSRRWKKLKRAMHSIAGKMSAQQNDILHKTSHNFVKWAKENNIKTVVVGDVEGVQRNTSGRKKANPKKKRRSRKINQKLSQWSFGLLLSYLTYKLAANPIELVKENEAWTTQTCPVCNRKKKSRGRVYSCYCGYREHRDLHGARNILSLYKYKVIKNLDIKIDEIKYLRPAASGKSSRKLCSEPVRRVRL
ncbi:RNA-guided endonuclease InsQ/TnpB family protein [Candidatus Uabimicrobium amorphum]|uniref:Transposase n=1 Tax=Uabimicrobium amorphum TaxID=2596890 RepID=A0A5S9IP73_UABAM|nr:RNA-guided endonuclease TnpB family protein [Candidatus Uabimicrobium amorphum]BBM85344.1 transposase [Candidatus Uabimicrobium amorphum]